MAKRQASYRVVVPPLPPCVRVAQTIRLWCAGLALKSVQCRLYSAARGWPDHRQTARLYPLPPLPFGTTTRACRAPCSNGYAETSYFRVTNPDNVFQKIIKGGRYNFATGTKWKTLPNYSWDLPHAGKYTLIVTLRTYTSSAGWGKVKLDVAPNDDAKKAKLNVADNEKVKYGKSQRMMVYWKTKRFSFVNHAATFTWQVEVTGKLKIVLQGSASAGNIGIQNDGNGYASCIWLKMQGVEKGILA